MKRKHVTGVGKTGKTKHVKGSDQRPDDDDTHTVTEDDLDDILESVASGQTELGNQNQTIIKLKKQVCTLQSTVDELRTKVDFLLSALDWTLPQSKPKTPSNKSASGSGSGVQPDAGAGSTSGSGGVSTDPDGDKSSTKVTESFTEVVRRRHSKTERSIRDAVVAAVYVDEQRKSSRVTNLVVSGLQPLPGANDKTVFVDLCKNEIGVTPDIVHCRRLGKHDTDRAKPLLVVLRTAEQADLIMSRAKNLRRSTHAFVKERVYINRHLTDAEARAAYELRCERRELAKRHGQQRSTSTDASTEDATTMDTGATTTSSSEAAADASAPVSRELHVTAPEFVPPASSSSAAPPAPSGSK